MKLKSIPIIIILDEVTIQAEVCENFRNETASQQGPTAVESTGSYGFIPKVIDGIMLSINSVSVQFNSQIFSASVELTRITVESRNCQWKVVDDLSKTRIRDPSRGQVLIFKHIEWQTLRFVAKSETNAGIGQAPLRLIANQASCRITLKKRLSDCAILGARITLIFDDLLWVLTDSQLLSALHFADYLGNLMKRAPRTKNFDLTKQQQASGKMFSMNAQPQNSPSKQNASQLTNSLALLFTQYDFLETSFHLFVKRIEVHLMDDFGPQSERSQCPELSEGGALQITLLRLLIDIYPYQSVDGNRKHWFRYSDPSASRQSFINHKIRSFYAKQQAQFQQEGSNFNAAQLTQHLLSRVLVIRLSDYQIGCVSTNSNRSNNKTIGPDGLSESIKLVQFDQSAVIPANISAVYLEVNSYFYIEPFDRLASLPVPDVNIFAHVAPVKIFFEPLTILWMNAFFANLRHALVKLKEAFPMDDAAQGKTNVRAEVLMPTVVLSLPPSSSSADDLEYSSLEVKISRILLFNCDSAIQQDYFKSLDNLIQRFGSNIDFFFEKQSYPWMSCDMKSISDVFMNKIQSIFTKTSNGDVGDFWSIHIQPVWVELKSSKNNRVDSFVEPINLTLWVHEAPESNSETAMASRDIDLNVFVDIADAVKVQISHGQLMFLMRLVERISDFTSMLNYDTFMIQRGHFKRDLLQRNNQQETATLSFDMEEEIVGKIFKTAAIVGNIPEIYLYLVLKSQDVYVESPLLVNSVKSISSTQIAHSSTATTTSDSAIGSRKDLDGDDDARVQVANNSIDDAFKDRNSSSCSLESLPNGSKIVLDDPLKVLSAGRSTPNHLPLSRCVGESSSPNGPSSTNTGSVNNLQATSHSPTVYVPQASKSKTMSSSHSFDTASMRIHYDRDEDAISTISDFSVDDSDQQSFIALMKENIENFDDLFLDEAVEVGEELLLDNEETLNESDENLACENGDSLTHPANNMLKSTILDVLAVEIKNLNLIQQSSKGFLSQVCLDLLNPQIREYAQIDKQEFDELFKQCNTVKASDIVEPPNEDQVDDQPKADSRITVRIDSFTKGTLRDEMIGVRVCQLKQSLNKETIDLIVDFFNDKHVEKVAPTSIVLENVQFKIVDAQMRIPDAQFSVPKLMLARNKENKWVVEFDGNLARGMLFCLLVPEIDSVFFLSRHSVEPSIVAVAFEDIPTKLAV